MVCILIEMYTGELFYETREDVEHLAMIEKECGAFPEWMARNTRSQRMRGIFNQDFELKKCEGIDMRIDWPKASRKDSSHENWLKMKTMRNLV